MKLVRTVEGELVPREEWELKNALHELKARLDARFEDAGPAQRASLVLHLRRRWTEVGTILSAEDEEVLSLFSEKVIEFRQVQLHFGPRLLESWLF